MVFADALVVYLRFGFKLLAKTLHGSIRCAPKSWQKEQIADVMEVTPHCLGHSSQFGVLCFKLGACDPELEASWVRVRFFVGVLE